MSMTMRSGLGTRLDSLRHTSGSRTAIGCLRSTSCRGDALINETELNIWAWTLEAQGARADALEAFEALTALLPKAAATWFGLASVATDAGDFARARRAVARVLELAPAHQGALRLRGRLPP